jgi:hypothetical protein
VRHKCAVQYVDLTANRLKTIEERLLALPGTHRSPRVSQVGAEGNCIKHICMDPVRLLLTCSITSNAAVGTIPHVPWMPSEPAGNAGAWTRSKYPEVSRKVI